MTITATDDENTNDAQLIVIVEDVNDESPVFSNTSCQVPVSVREVRNLLLYIQMFYVIREQACKCSYMQL